MLAKIRKNIPAYSLAMLLAVNLSFVFRFFIPNFAHISLKRQVAILGLLVVVLAVIGSWVIGRYFCRAVKQRKPTVIAWGMILGVAVVFLMIKQVGFYTAFFHPVEFTVTALGYHNPDSQGSDVRIANIKLDGKLVSYSSFIGKQSWEVKGKSIISIAEQPADLTWIGVGVSRISISFITNPWSGFARISAFGETQYVDFYSPAYGKKTLHLVSDYPVPDIYAKVANISSTFLLVIFFITCAILLMNNREEFSELVMVYLADGKWQSLALAVIICGSIFVAYSPAWIIPFGMPDDYVVLSGYLKTGPYQMDRHNLINQGRAGIYYLISIFIRPKSIASFTGIRSVTEAGFALFACCLFFVLKRKFQPLSAVIFALLSVSLPAFQTWLAWGILQSTPYCAFFMVVAAVLVGRKGDQHRIFRYLSPVSGMFIFWLGLNIYQPAAMFYFSASAILIFAEHREWKAVLKRSAISILTGAGTLAIYYVTLRISQNVMGFALTRTQLASDWLGKIAWFLSDPLVTALNFHYLKANPILAICSGFVILTGLFWYFQGKYYQRLGMLLMAISFVLLSYVPNLVIELNWGAYRTLPAMNVILLFYLLLALKGYRNLLGKQHLVQQLKWSAVMRWAAVAACAGALLLANLNFLRFFAMPLYIEHRFLKEELVHGLNDSVTSVTILRPNWHEGVSAMVRKDEFGLPSTFAPYSAVALTNILLHEINPAQTGLIVDSMPVDEYNGDIRPDELVIDMSRLVDFQNK